MSRSGNEKLAAMEQGPYGPDNPPPPPPDGAPGEADHERGRGFEKAWPLVHNSEPPKGNGRAYNHRKLNSRQRKQRKLEMEQAKQDERRQLDRSRSPAWRQRENSQSTYRERSPAPRVGGLYEGEARRGPRVQRRGTLQDARQITPDQIMDETRGRLSPGGVVSDRFQEPDEKTQRQNTKRMNWPDEPSQPPNPANDMQRGFNSRFSSKMDKSSDRHKHENRGSQYAPSAMSAEAEHATNKQPRSMMSQPKSFPGQGYGVEDEVDWDDNDAFNMPNRDLPSNATLSYQVRPQQTAYGGEKGYAGDQRQHDEGRRQWEKKNRKIPQPQPPPYRNSTADGPAPKNAPYKPHSHGDRFGGPNQEQDFMSRRMQDEQQKEPFFSKTVKSVPTRARTTPDSVYDLRKYDAYVTDLHNDLPKHLAYRNGNGKAAPHMYGSEQGQDLGLCFVTFCTSGWCELGVNCAWRHHPLTKAEREWIHQGRERGKLFLQNLGRYWGTPEIPVPGASMHDK